MSHSTPVTLISFAFGDAYYQEAAERLAQDCHRLGVPCHIERPALPSNTSWVDACRYKVRFISECRRHMAGPLCWVDVDCRLLRPLPALGPDVDLGFFLRGFRDLRDFDPVGLPRFIQPSILHIGEGPLAREFVEGMASRDACFDKAATDDWFMHEAWRGMSIAPSVLIMPPSWVVQDDASIAGPAIFRFGRSGQATTHKGLAEQHDIDLFSPARRKLVLMREASEALRDGRGVDANVFLRRALEAEPSDAALAHRVARAWHRAGRTDQAESVLGRVPSGPQGHAHVYRFQLDVALEEGRIDDAQRLADHLLAGTSEPDRHWAESRQMRIGLEQRAIRARLKPEQRPALWWMEGPYPGNVGDILNPYVVEKLSGAPPRRVDKGEGMLAIGSTIRFAREGTQVWGAGAARQTDRVDPCARYAAVRGPLTADLVEASGAPRPSVLGDPAALLPRLYTPRSVRARTPVGLVLHHAHSGLLVTGQGVQEVPILRAGYAGIEAFIDELWQCERILTSSLHGLIIAHAYGIPALWIDVSDAAHAVPGDGMKFRDYLLSVGSAVSKPHVFAPGDVVERKVAVGASLPPGRIDLDTLAAAFPWRRRRWWQR